MTTPNAEETDEQIREKYRKDIEAKSKHLKPISKEDFSNPTKDQKKDIKKIEAKVGKVMVEKEKEPPPSTTYKYSKNGKGDLYESILIVGQPFFVTYNHAICKIEVYPEIVEKFRTLRPAEPSEYSYPPYEFGSREELERFHTVAKKENLDTLLSKAKSFVSMFNDQDRHKLDSIASDVVWPYFQVRFATTRYEALTGGVGSGKSALAATYGAIGYRPVNTTNPTAAVIYRLLGNIEPGQCTMILEEAEKIDQNYEIMAILKTGYTRDGKVDRTNPNTLKPEFFNSYCFKIIVAERSPNQDSGKGVVDRSFVHSCFKGYPQYDIKEILNPTNTGGPEHQALRIKLEDFRKLLLMYRLYHFRDEIPDIDIGIIGSDKELVKPTLQLFHDTKSQAELVETFQTILDLKNRRKATSQHAALLDVVISAIPNIDEPISSLDGKVELSSKNFWALLPDRIEGRQDDDRPGDYHSTEFGTLYKGTVGKILHDNFGMESRHTKTGTVYTINRHTIKRLRAQLNSKISINQNQNQNQSQVTTVTAVTAGDEEGSTFDSQNDMNLTNNPHLQDPSPPSPPSPPETRPQATCPKCNHTEDAFYMNIHIANCEAEGTD